MQNAQCIVTYIAQALREMQQTQKSTVQFVERRDLRGTRHVVTLVGVRCGASARKSVEHGRETLHRGKSLQGCQLIRSYNLLACNAIMQKQQCIVTLIAAAASVREKALSTGGKRSFGAKRYKSAKTKNLSDRVAIHVPMIPNERYIVTGKAQALCWNAANTKKFSAKCKPCTANSDARLSTLRRTCKRAHWERTRIAPSAQIAKCMNGTLHNDIMQDMHLFVTKFTIQATICARGHAGYGT